MTIYCTNKYFNDPLAKKKKKKQKNKNFNQEKKITTKVLL